MMKKYLMTGIAALAISAGFTSCSKDDFEPMTQAQIDKAKYDQAFRNYVGGTIAAGQTWGFGNTNTSRAFTRANALIEGDPFTFENTDSYYINNEAGIPATAKTYEDAVAAVTTVYDWGSYFDENNFQNATEVIFPDGTYAIHWWANSHTLYVTGNVTLNVNNDKSINKARIYLLSGSTLNLNMDNFINDLEIYVANNATLNYNAEKLYKQDGGGKIYNRGTLNVPDNFEINQEAIVYNEGTINGKDFTSKPGDGHTSFLYNYGNLDLTGDMILNSCANFYNEGTVTVNGNTEATQKDIWWINKGHYTTNTLTLHPWNKTFYNYCQLLVNGNAHLFNGEFTLMDNSYMECATAELDNFIVNMGSNTGMYIKGDVRMIAQGDGTFQGFRTNGGSNDYLLIGGKVTVDAHYHTFSVSEGITYSVNQIEIIKDSEVVTDEYLKSIGDGAYPVLDLNGTACPYGELTVTPNTNSCGATWSTQPSEDPTPGDDPTPSDDPTDDPVEETTLGDLRIMGEDLSAIEAGDFDFNDIVIDVKFDASNAILILRAAGGTLPLRIAENDQWEVHTLFGVGEKVMVNTAHGRHHEYEPVEIKLPFGVTSPAEAKNIKLEVMKSGEWQELTAEISEPAAKLAVGTDCEWLDERTSIKDVYKSFVEWASENPNLSQWWKQ